MKTLLFLFLLYFSFPSQADNSDLSSEVSEKLSQVERSIWKVNSSNAERNATGFFIGKNLFVTDLVAIGPLKTDGSLPEDLFLSQEGNPSALKVKKIITLSLFTRLPHATETGLVLLETEQKVSHYLSIREQPPESNEPLFVSVYYSDDLKRISKTGRFFYKDSQSFLFPADQFILTNAVGSPVLDEQGQVVGVVSVPDRILGLVISDYVIENAWKAVNSNYLTKFIKGEEGFGVNCSDFDNFSICIEKTKESLKKLAEEGSPFAQYKVAVQYYHEAENYYDLYGKIGKGAEILYKQAGSLLEQAVAQGYAPALHFLGEMCYFLQLFESCNPQDGILLLEQAAEKGYIFSYSSLGYKYEEPFPTAFHKFMNTENRLRLSFEWYEKGARMGHTAAQYQAWEALYYDYHGDEGKTKVEAMKVAFQWAKEAAQQGDSQAQFNLGAMYYAGKGTTPNIEESFKWYERAAQQGDTEAQHRTCMLLYHVGRNTEGAVEWCERAALQGHLEAQQTTAQLYKELGDQEKAEEWFRKAETAKRTEAVIDFMKKVHELWPPKGTTEP